MTRRPGPPRPEDHPLAGVLDRLLARERGDDRRPRPEAAVVPAPSTSPRALRRMLVIAGLGADEGKGAVCEVARWGLRHGRHPATLEVGCATSAPVEDAADGPAAPQAPRLPMASVPCGPEHLRVQSPEVVAELIGRLQRHESASDLLLLRTPPRHRTVLLRAALLAGGIILPLEDSDAVLYEAFQIAREVTEYFVDLAVWPFTDQPRALDRFLTTTRDVLGVEPRPFTAAMTEGAAVLENLPGAPEEGFLAGILALDTTPAPTQLLRTGFLRL